MLASCNRVARNFERMTVHQHLNDSVWDGNMKLVVDVRVSLSIYSTVSRSPNYPGSEPLMKKGFDQYMTTCISLTYPLLEEYN